MSKRPLEETIKTGTEKKLVQTKLSFTPRTSFTPSAPPLNRYPFPSSSSASSSNRYILPTPSSAPSSAPSSSRHFSNYSSSGPSQRRSSAGSGGLFKNRQWVRQDSGGSSSLSGLSILDKDGDKDETEGLDGREERPKKQKPYSARYNMDLAAVAKETM